MINNNDFLKIQIYLHVSLKPANTINLQINQFLNQKYIITLSNFIIFRYSRNKEKARNNSLVNKY